MSYGGVMRRSAPVLAIAVLIAACGGGADPAADTDNAPEVADEPAAEPAEEPAPEDQEPTVEVAADEPEPEAEPEPGADTDESGATTPQSGQAPPEAILDCVAEQLGAEAADALRNAPPTDEVAPVLGACMANMGGGGSSSDAGPGSSGTCAPDPNATRTGATPVGVLMPSGYPAGQSYTSAAAVAEAGFNAISLGMPYLYDSDGTIVFDRMGATDDGARARWLDSIGCLVSEIKAEGLIALVWGQFQDISNPRGQEPKPPSPELADLLGEQVTALLPDIAAVLEAHQVDYFAPASEADKWLGAAGHQKHYPRWTSAVRPHFSGVIYAQPNMLGEGFGNTPGVEPDLYGVDAVSVAWISFRCDRRQLDEYQAFLDDVRADGIEVFIGEIGDVMAGNPDDAACLDTVVDTLDPDGNGLLVLDSPTDMPGGSQVNGTWLADWLISRA